MEREKSLEKLAEHLTKYIQQGGGKLKEEFAKRLYEHCRTMGYYNTADAETLKDRTLIEGQNVVIRSIRKLTKSQLEYADTIIKELSENIPEKYTKKV